MTVVEAVVGGCRCEIGAEGEEATETRRFVKEKEAEEEMIGRIVEVEKSLTTSLVVVAVAMAKTMNPVVETMEVEMTMAEATREVATRAVAKRAEERTAAEMTAEETTGVAKTVVETAKEENWMAQGTTRTFSELPTEIFTIQRCRKNSEAPPNNDPDVHYMYTTTITKKTRNSNSNGKKQ